MKKCSSFLALWEMQIKTVVRFHLTHVRITIIKNTNNMLAKIWRKMNPHTLLMGMQISITTMENSMEAPHKTKNSTAV
jgi:hypothetical protein